MTIFSEIFCCDFIALYPNVNFLFYNVMGDTVTRSTDREFLVNSFRMRHAMTILTLGNSLVNLGMTESTLKSLVLGVACPQHIKCFLMTGCTVLGSDVVRIGNLQRFMRIMAGQTITLLLTIFVRLMAMLTVRNKSMPFTMTGAALHRGGMLAGILLERGPLIGMTGQAGSCNIIRQRDIQRSMGVAVTSKAVVETEMGTIFSMMTLAALGNVVRDRRRMADVAVETGDFFFMLVTVCGDIAWRSFVALDTVING